MKKTRVMILLGAVLVALLAGYLVLKGLDLGREEPPVTEQISLAELGEVTAFTIEYGGEVSSYELAENGDWVCMEDDTLTLDQDRVQSVAVRAASLTATQLVTDDAGRHGEFELKEPRCQITASGRDGDSYTLLIGSEQRFNSSCYVRFEDQDAVYTLPLDVAQTFCVSRRDLSAAADPD